MAVVVVWLWRRQRRRLSTTAVTAVVTAGWMRIFVWVEMTGEGGRQGEGRRETGGEVGRDRETERGRGKGEGGRVRKGEGGRESES